MKKSDNVIVSTRALEQCVLRMKDLVLGEDCLEAVLRFYRILLTKLSGLVNEKKVHCYVLSTLYTMSKTSDEETFARVLEESAVAKDEWLEYSCRKQKIQAPVKEEEPDLFSSLKEG